MLRVVARWILVFVLALDAVFAIAVLSGGLTTIGAETGSSAEAAEAPESDEPSVWTQDALNELGRELRERAAELERREAEVEELLRGGEVLERAGVTGEETAAAEEPPGTAPADAAAVPDAPPRRREAFTSLQRAYENMEPDTAARALSALAERDKDAVVQLLLGWQPRTSGAILDSLTQTNATLAADLSYEIWKLDGKSEP